MFTYPDVFTVPLKPAPPLAKHEVALVEFQVRLEEFPEITELGLAVRVTVGNGVCC